MGASKGQFSNLVLLFVKLGNLWNGMLTKLETKRLQGTPDFNSYKMIFLWLHGDVKKRT